ncbi:endoglucanase B [Aureobasidium pullulans]|uniref:2-amino-4-hydroxy-6-hydroxymethyldihydropteridine diphosphokinase n=1 Tax=Aureobasidium pullulans TaxID=5580 RepID=A0A4T0CBV9_AURPU|nr:endoglucanase B [Aureobasidium pullulans]
MPSALRRKFFSSNDPQEGSSSSASDVGTTEMHLQDPERYGAQGDSKHPQNEVIDQDQSSEDVPNEAAQDGVTQAEAITLSWNKTSMIATYALMWSIYCVNAFQSNITGNLSAYITSGFEAHSLLPVISIISSIMGAATYMPLAKVLNLWDRTVGLIIMLVFFLLGLILAATCNDIGTYCASQVFYAIGSAGLIFCVDVVTIDTSTLRSRGLAYALTSSPFIITAYAGPAAAEQFYDTNWRWGYGTFCIVLPAVVLPFFGLLHYFKSKAKRNGLLKDKPKSGRTFKENVWYYIIEFDVLGVFLGSSLSRTHHHRSRTAVPIQHSPTLRRMHGLTSQQDKTNISIMPLFRRDMSTDSSQVRRCAYIALGSNVGDRLDMIEKACLALDQDQNIKVTRTSSLYETEPMYVEDQARFLNGACEGQVETTLEPMTLLDRLQAIENELGRVKLIDKGPRSIDLDILLYENQYHPRGYPFHWQNAGPTHTIWGSEADKAALEADIANIRNNFTDVPLIIGEWAASPVATETAARWRYFDFFVRTAAKYNTTTVLWDNGADFLDRANHVWRDQTAIDIYMSAVAGEANALPDSTTDPSAATQFTSADLFVRVGQSVSSQTLPYILPSNISPISISGADGTALTKGSDYSVSGDDITFSASFLRTYFTSSISPGSVTNLTLDFSSGADLTLNLVLWDTPVLSSTSSSAAAANGSSISIPIQWKGINKPATVKAVTANGTYLVDDFTSYYGPLQNARTTYNSQWNWDTDNVIITAAAVSAVQALGQDVIFTFEFYPRVPGDSVNYTLTV